MEFNTLLDRMYKGKNKRYIRVIIETMPDDPDAVHAMLEDFGIKTSTNKIWRLCEAYRVTHKVSSGR